MRRVRFLVLPLLFALTYSVISEAQPVDTLRNYDPDASRFRYFSSNAIYYMSRFDLPAPGYLKKIRIQLEGIGNGELRLFGHEGGSHVGELEEDLITPITFTKIANEREFIEIELDTAIWLDNAQFFVAVSLLSGNLAMVRESTLHEAYCTSTSGGAFHPTILAVPGSHPYYSHLWQTSRFGLIIDVLMEYPLKESPAYFVDVTEKMGIPLTISSRTIAWGDYDNDGYLDLLVGGRLFKNNMGESFTEVTQQKGIHGSARGNAFVDINNDGLLDIIIFHNDNHLYINNGDGSFSHYVLTALPRFGAISSFNFADLNNDKYPDLFIGQLWSSYPVPETNYLYYNTGMNDFSDETTRLYPSYDGVRNFPQGVECIAGNASTYLPNRNRNRRSRGSQFVDFNNDGHPDLYVANYFLERDELFLNDGMGNFSDIITVTNIDINTGGGANHGSGVDWADYDNDGYMDLLLPQLAHPWGKKFFNHQGTTLYRNNGHPEYTFTAVEGNAGIQYEETHAGGTWGDINNDGLSDLIITTFYGCRYIDLYVQKADNTFKRASFEYGLERIATGRDAVFVDFDNDGRLDLAVGNDDRFRLYKNTRNMMGRNWVQIDLQAENSNHFGVGARVTVMAGGKKYNQEVNLGRGALMQKPMRLFFGLDRIQIIDNIIVNWPNGKTEEFGRFQPNKIYKLIEGKKVEGRNETADFTVYPNPNRGLIYFGLVVDEAVLIDLAGRELGVIRNSFEWNIEGLGLAEGLYFVRITSEGETALARFILMK